MEEERAPTGRGKLNDLREIKARAHGPATLIARPMGPRGHAAPSGSLTQNSLPPMERAMTTTLDDLLPTAKDLQKKLALAESEKAAESARREAAEQAEKKALLDHLSKPSGVSDEERMKRAA